MSPQDIIKSFVHNLFAYNTSFIEKNDDYNNRLMEIFKKQGDRVIYPNDQVTCFKFRGKTYFNPTYPKIFENQVEVNLRHLHPSLLPEMTLLEKEINDLGETKRRLQAYLQRSINPFFEIINNNWDYQLSEHQMAQTFMFYMHKVIPDCMQTLVNPSNSYGIPFGLSKDDHDRLQNELKIAAAIFQENNQSTIEQFNLFCFKTTVLGM